jgi:hypothetical protein
VTSEKAFHTVVNKKQSQARYTVKHGPDHFNKKLLEDSLRQIPVNQAVGIILNIQNTPPAEREPKGKYTLSFLLERLFQHVTQDRHKLQTCEFDIMAITGLITDEERTIMLDLCTHTVRTARLNPNGTPTRAHILVGNAPGFTYKFNGGKVRMEEWPKQMLPIVNKVEAFLVGNCKGYRQKLLKFNGALFTLHLKHHGLGLHSDGERGPNGMHPHSGLFFIPLLTGEKSLEFTPKNSKKHKITFKPDPNTCLYTPEGAQTHEKGYEHAVTRGPHPLCDLRATRSHSEHSTSTNKPANTDNMQAAPNKRPLVTIKPPHERHHKRQKQQHDEHHEHVSTRMSKDNANMSLLLQAKRGYTLCNNEEREGGCKGGDGRYAQCFFHHDIEDIRQYTPKNYVEQRAKQNCAGDTIQAKVQIFIWRLNNLGAADRRKVDDKHTTYMSRFVEKNKKRSFTIKRKRFQ